MNGGQRKAGGIAGKGNTRDKALRPIELVVGVLWEASVVAG